MKTALPPSCALYPNPFWRQKHSSFRCMLQQGYGFTQNRDITELSTTLV